MFFRKLPRILPVAFLSLLIDLSSLALMNETVREQAETKPAFLTDQASDEPDFWQAQGLPTQVVHLLTQRSNYLLLLEPGLLAKVQANTPKCTQSEDQRCADRLRDLTWKFNLTSTWSPNWLTVGAVGKDLPKVNLSSFVEIHRDTSPGDNQTLLHAFYQSAHESSGFWAFFRVLLVKLRLLSPRTKTVLHVVVLKQILSNQSDFSVDPVSPETKVKFGSQLSVDFTSSLKLINLTTSPRDGVLFPADIPAFLSRFPSLQYPPIRERVAAVDEALRLLSRHSPESTLDYVHPQASEADLLSHNASATQLMKSARQLERSRHLSLDISRPCGGNFGLNLTLLVLVFNRASDLDRRQAIRDTFGAELRNSTQAEIYFFIAKPENPSVQAQLLSESSLYGDLIQVDYTESYYNCTVKAVALLRWTALNCPLVKYLLKLDDDSYLRPRPLLNWLSALPQANRAIGGSIPAEGTFVSTVVHREGAYGLSRRYFPAEHYPSYIANAYFLPGRLAVALYEAVLGNIPAIPFEDAYVTGILAEAIDLPRNETKRMVNTRSSPLIESSELEGKIILYDGLSPEAIRHYGKLWK